MNETEIGTVKVFMSCMSAYKWVYTIEKVLNNQVDKITCSVYISLFPSYLCSWNEFTFSNQALHQNSLLERKISSLKIDCLA